METVDLHRSFEKKISYEELIAMSAEERSNISDYEFSMPSFESDQLEDDDWGHVILHMRSPVYESSYAR